MAQNTAAHMARRDTNGRAYELLRDAILDGTLAPGSQLVEMTLAQSYGVSRTPIREALSRLEQAGLVARSSRGLVVRARSPEEILDIYEVRIVLEAKASELAANRHSDFDAASIAAAVRTCDGADASAATEMVRANDQFHQAIWGASRNETLQQFLEQIRMHVARYSATTLSYGNRWAEALAEHHAIAEAIMSGDSELAHRLSAEHFTRARDIRIEQLRLGIT